MSNKTDVFIKPLFFPLIYKIPLQLLLGLSLILLLFSAQFIYAIFIKPCKESLKSQISVTSPYGHQIQRLDQGRFFLSAKEGPLHIRFTADEPAHFLIFKKACETPLKISIQGGEAVEIQEERYFIPVPKTREIACTVETSQGKLIIQEIGLTKTINAPKKHRLVTLAKLLLMPFLGLILLWRLNKVPAGFGFVYFFLLSFFTHLAYLFFTFSPELGRDLRAYFASGPLYESLGCNLNYGLYMASSILQGKGPLIGEIAPWCRMPGYGFILALCGNAFDLLQMAIHAVILQIILFSLSIAFFFSSALRIMPLFRAAFITTMIQLFPLALHKTHIESMTPTVVIFCLAVGCLLIEKVTQNKPISLRLHLLFHLGFAIWFSLRTDILPAWAIISLILYARNIRHWKYFLIPITLCLAISLPWALFKLPIAKEFSMTTNSVGASMMVGLWEIPHKFIWTIDDASYFTWADRVSMLFDKKTTSDFAVKEVFGFCLTYPVYLFSLILHKFLFYAKDFGFHGKSSDYIAIPWKSFALIFPLILSLATKYKRFQTLILSWPVFFNVPIFFLFYSAYGKFYIAPTLSLLIASFALLLDPEFYRKIIASWKKTAMISVAFIAIMGFGPMLDEYLIKNDSLRYWAPFSDPAKSTLNVVKN